MVGVGGIGGGRLASSSNNTNFDYNAEYELTVHEYTTPKGRKPPNENSTPTRFMSLSRKG